MSDIILNRLEELEQELGSLESKLLARKADSSNQDQESEAKNIALQKELKAEQSKNKQVSDVLYKNISKLEKIIEKEERSDA